MDVVYLDYNATTPIDPRVLDSMLPFLREPSNAGSRTHLHGQRSKAAIDAARAHIASIAGVQPEEIVFTSGATESNNIALAGLAEHGRKTGRRHIISTAIEHKAVLEPLNRLSKQGFDVELAPVTRGGFVEAEEIAKRLRPETLLVSVMHANNETGVLQPIEEVAKLLEKTMTLFHVDAAQTFGKEPGLGKVKFDLASISGHKIYGPQGIGALCLRKGKLDRRAIDPIAIGGGQERGFRPGTVPTALAVGLGTAAELAGKENERWRLQNLRTRKRLLEAFGAVAFEINGDEQRSQPHVLNVRFPGVDSEALMMAMRDRVSISNGSACTSSSYRPSHVLQAMGLSDDDIASAVRISWGWTVDSIPGDTFVDSIRALSA